jgi:caffeoyl-CoA O-methyltransferase
MALQLVNIMSEKFIPLTPELYNYVIEHRSDAQDAVLAELRAKTAALGDISRMQISREQGSFLTLLVAATGTRTAVEVGTFTGYSALCIARGLPADGRLYCFDMSEEWTSMGRPYWERAQVASKIDLRLGPALDNLRQLPDASIDFAFVDADKSNYDVYYEFLLPRLRPNGLIIFDNMLWDGRVLEKVSGNADTEAIKTLNDKLANDPRVQSVLLPVADGLNVCRKLG